MVDFVDDFEVEVVEVEVVVVEVEAEVVSCFSNGLDEEDDKIVVLSNQIKCQKMSEEKQNKQCIVEEVFTCYYH